MHLSPTTETIKKAKAFLFEKWKDRAKEMGFFVIPKDLSSSCKFSSLFAQAIFGGTLQGNWHHQFVLLDDGSILDLNEDAQDVLSMEAPYTHDPKFWNNREHKESLASCKPRVKTWVEEFLNT